MGGGHIQFGFFVICKDVWGGGIYSIRNLRDLLGERKSIILGAGGAGSYILLGLGGGGGVRILPSVSGKIKYIYMPQLLHPALSLLLHFQTLFHEKSHKSLDVVISQKSIR